MGRWEWEHPDRSRGMGGMGEGIKGITFEM